MQNVGTEISNKQLESALLAIRRYSAHIPDVVDFKDCEESFHTDNLALERMIFDTLSAPREKGICRELVIPDPRTRIFLELSSATIVERIQKSGVVTPLCTREISADSATVWDIHLQRILQMAADYPYVVVGDFANYFEMIRFARLLPALEKAGVERELASQVLDALRKCSVAQETTLAGHVGLPQIPDSCCLVIGNAYLKPFDDFFSAADLRCYRFMDDFFVGVQSLQQGQRLLLEVSRMANSMGLAINSKKTRIIPKVELDQWFHLSTHRSLDQLELEWRFKLISPDDAHRQFSLIHSNLRDTSGSGCYEVALRRAYRVGALIRFDGLVRHLPDDLAIHPSSADAIASYLRALGSSAEAVEAVRAYLDHPLAVYQTPEVGILAATFLGGTNKNSEQSIRLAKDVLGNRVRTSSDLSIGLSALLVAREIGSYGLAEYACDLSKHFANASFVFRRYWVASCALCGIPIPDIGGELHPDERDLDYLNSYIRRQGIEVPSPAQKNPASIRTS